MINLSFNIINPWINRFETVKHWHGNTWFKHKFWEINILKTRDIIGFHFDLSTRRDHAGLSIRFDLLGYSISFDIYDNRHWDTDSDFWASDK